MVETDETMKNAVLTREFGIFGTCETHCIVTHDDTWKSVITKTTPKSPDCSSRRRASRDVGIDPLAVGVCDDKYLVSIG